MRQQLCGLVMTTTLTIASWNVNSVKARLEHVQQWLRESGTDIVCLQELKCIEDMFPRSEIEDLGYNVAIVGQKTYNGVAVLSKFPIEVEQRALPGDDSDEQARYIETVASLPDNKALRVASVYVPNGQALDSEKFPYKMKFYERLYDHLSELLTYEEITVIAGDYNVAPAPADVYDAKKLDGSICYHPLEREALRRLTNLGYADAWRLIHAYKEQYSWWDYRGGGYQAGKGLRIDHLLCSAQAVDCLSNARIDETPRAWEKPSDHAPVIAELVI